MKRPYFSLFFKDHDMAVGKSKNSKTWVVYILRCKDDTFYTGITNDIEKRLAAHQRGTAAKYTRSRRPVCLMAISAKMKRSEAMRLEIDVKKKPREKKTAALKKSRTKKHPTIVKSKNNDHSVSRNDLKSIAGFWRVCLKKLHRKIPVQGSPERSIFRIVLEDQNGKYFVLEQISEKSLADKRRIVLTLDYLAAENCACIQPYLTSEEGDHWIKHKEYFWQMIPYVRGEDLDRGKYMYDEWRGKALAAFLIELRHTSKEMPSHCSDGIFSLKKYIYKLVREINLYNSDIQDEIQTIAGFLEKDFMRIYENLPVAFCHGDYHPLNIIWSDEDIRCVIDWEFCGIKSELYDAANLIGCVGMEDPRSLTGGLVNSFIADLKTANIISPESWKYLLEFIVALRFAWMAEWLRRKDADMIRLELDYMRLLMDHKNILQKAWL